MSLANPPKGHIFCGYRTSVLHSAKDFYLQICISYTHQVHISVYNAVDVRNLANHLRCIRPCKY